MVFLVVLLVARWPAPVLKIGTDAISVMIFRQDTLAGGATGRFCLRQLCQSISALTRMRPSGILPSCLSMIWLCLANQNLDTDPGRL